jgi:TM2 domain-containing membrane protein YozV
MHHAPPKSRAAYVVLGIFLGGLGIHNFYAGHTGRGLAQLLLMIFTGWMCFPVFVIWLWNIIEIIVTDTDGSGQRMT